MNTHKLAVIGVVLSIGIAGCTGIMGPDQTTPSTESAPTDTVEEVGTEGQQSDQRTVSTTAARTRVTDSTRATETTEQTTDSDGDGLTNRQEVSTYGTNSTVADTDGDGLEDGAEINQYSTNPLSSDTDGDGLTDGEEVNIHGTSPRKVDTDFDQFSDSLEVAAPPPIAEADPLEKDIFVEIDYMAGQTPSIGSLERVAEQFEKSPVKNPNGTTGINLHLVKSNKIEYRSQTTPGMLNKTRQQHFDHQGQGYHYVVFVNSPVVEGEDVLGVANLSVSNRQSAIRHYAHSNNNAEVFMHFLGHSLGLSPDDYVGIDSEEMSAEKYPSVMNFNAISSTKLAYLQYSNSSTYNDWDQITHSRLNPTPSAFK